jgi:cytochrome d ubiquinol oxidase subunit I
MVAIGSFAALISLIILFSKWRKIDLTSKHQFLLFMMLSTPLGFIAIEAGWIVTEVGRQPWIIYEILRTADSVSPMPGLHYSLFLFLGLYSSLAFMVGWLMFRQFKQFNLTDGKNV